MNETSCDKHINLDRFSRIECYQQINTFAFYKLNSTYPEITLRTLSVSDFKRWLGNKFYFKFFYQKKKNTVLKY